MPGTRPGMTSSVEKAGSSVIARSAATTCPPKLAERRWKQSILCTRRGGLLRCARNDDAGSIVLHHRALAPAEGTRGVLGRRGGGQLEIIEGVLGFRGLLHLEEVIGPHHAAVLAHRALGVEVIDRQLLPFRPPLGGI